MSEISKINAMVTKFAGGAKYKESHGPNGTTRVYDSGLKVTFENEKNGAYTVLLRSECGMPCGKGSLTIPTGANKDDNQLIVSRRDRKTALPGFVTPAFDNKLFSADDDLFRDFHATGLDTIGKFQEEQAAREKATAVMFKKFHLNNLYPHSKAKSGN